MYNHFATEKVGPRRSRDGSALLTAVILTFVVGMLTASYLMRASSEYRLASRSFLMGAGFALAEGGIDHAMHALNSGDSSGWIVDGTTWKREFTDDLDITGGTSGRIRVVVLDADSDEPVVLSEGAVNGHVTGTLKKQVKVALSRGTFLGDAGFVANTIVNNGNRVGFYQFDSRLGAPNEILEGSGENAIRNLSDEMRVATASLTGGAVDVGNSDIFGYISTGGGEPDIGPNGGVYSLENPSAHDPSRISYDFYAEFPTVTAPTGLPSLSINPSLPVNTPIGSGNYEFDGTGSVLKTTNNKDIIIDGDVVIVVSDGGDISLGGDLYINEGGSLRIYTNGDVNISGDINNANTAENLAVYGTSTVDGAQTIKMHGAANLTAFIYAPSAVVELKGGGGNQSGNFQGAIVAYDATVNGNIQFYYDRALGDINLGGDDFEVIEWYELHDATDETARVQLAMYFE